MAEDGILRGWKEICGFLKMSRNTAVAQGYPVQRPKGKPRGTVFAFKAALVAHAQAMPQIEVEQDSTRLNEIEQD